MRYIKNNKIFIFLFTILLVFNSTLFYALIEGEDSFSLLYQNQHKENTISYFNGNFDENRMGVELNWDVELASSSVVKYEIFQNEKLLRTGNNSYSALLSVNEYKFVTGNNKFDLLVTLKDDTVLSKSVYVYINEVYDFNVTQNISDNSIIYNVTYLYDKRNPAGSLYMNLYDVTQPFEFNFISKVTEDVSDTIVKASAQYELVYTDVEPGRYELLIQWEFIDHNLIFDSTSNFDVVGE